MNILIIGSKGFIGSHAIHYFRKINHTVYGCDVVVDYETENYFQINASNANFQEVFSSAQFDICLNCSGAASVPDSFVHPLRDFELNVNNVFKILDAIRQFQPNCKFINLSSAAVYGNPELLPVRENSILQPVSPYGVHKKIAEEITASFYNNFQIPTLSLRLFSVYGPMLRKQLFWDLYKKMNSVSTIEIHGSGYESRDFLYIEDLMNAILLLITHHDFKGQSLNVASGEETYIKDAVQAFAEAIAWEGKVCYSNINRKGDPLNWKADVSYLHALSFKPSHTLKNGLKAYVSWLKEKI